MVWQRIVHLLVLLLLHSSVEFSKKLLHCRCLNLLFARRLGITWPFWSFTAAYLLLLIHTRCKEILLSCWRGGIYTESSVFWASGFSNLGASSSWNFLIEIGIVAMRYNRISIPHYCLNMIYDLLATRYQVRRVISTQFYMLRLP